MDRLNDEGGRALSALGILEAVEACTRASEMVERLDGTCITTMTGKRSNSSSSPSASRVTPTKDE